MTRPRSKVVMGRRLWWCSHFAAYVQAERCEGERRMAALKPDQLGKQVFRVKKGRRGATIRPDQAGHESRLDLLAAVAERKECLGCPGAVKRSLREKKEGKLS